ncbi:MAG: transposase family protein [Bryobacterales bacterium]|nr:transposase family protein [Bryobacterales bacterium]
MRRWRHLDTCQYKTILHAAPPMSGSRGAYGEVTLN